MAIHDNGVDVQVYKKLDDPIFVDYLWYRTGQINQAQAQAVDTPPRHILIKNLKDACNTASAFAFMHNYNVRNERPNGLEKWIDTLLDEFHTRCLTEKYYYWLDNKNTRLHYFTWRFLSHLGISIEKKDQQLEHKCVFLLSPSILDENIKTHTHTNKKWNTEISTQDITALINRLPCNKIEKEKLVRAISKSAESAMKNDDIKLWLNKQNKEKTTWLHKYLEHKEIDYVPLVLNGTSAQKDDLVSFLDVLSITNIDRYKLLVSNIKKAWSQKVYRDKNLEKKQYSINMSKDIGNILDELSQMEQKNKNTIIEELIREAYAKRCAI
ncbi:hypothetical protein [Aeromonas media]|uniref:hypothetical protein n=1 Tax=Aeromonas media TaxID=651 RepID=UPI003D255139